MFAMRKLIYLVVALSILSFSALPLLPPRQSAAQRIASPTVPPPQSQAGNSGAAYAQQEILVKFVPGVSLSRIRSINASEAASAKGRNSIIDVYRLELSPDTDVPAAARAYAQRPEVQFAEPNYVRRISKVPKDPAYEDHQRWFFTAINAEKAWDVETGKASVVVAVLDSGVKLDHPDLVGRIWTNPRENPSNGIDDDRNGYIDDVHGWDFVGLAPGGGPNLTGRNNPDIVAGDTSSGNGLDEDGDDVPDGGVPHGTMAAGLIAAATNNNTGVASTAWGVTILPVRILDPEGNGYTADVADGMIYAAANGAQIISLSSGGTYSMTEEQAVNSAHDEYGITIIAAAGNSGNGSVDYPAALPNTIAVGASAHANPNARASFSSWGPQVDLVAPGEDIFSTFVEPVTAQATYEAASGTSFSTPLVAGVAALMLSINPQLAPDHLRSILRATAQRLPDDPIAGPTWAGYGMVDAYAAVSAVLQPKPCLVQSQHPYADNYSNTWTLTNSNQAAQSTKVHFSRLETEAGYDFVTLSDGSNNAFQRLSGSYPQGLWSNAAAGRTVKVSLSTDPSQVRWGFCIDEIANGEALSVPPTATPTPTPTATPTPTPTVTPTPGPTTVASALLSVNGLYSLVYQYDPLNPRDPWKVYDPDAPPYVSTLQAVERGSAYWILMKYNGVLAFRQNRSLLYQGWNLVGWLG